MQERRTRRTSDPAHATQLLIDALAARSDARAVALVDGEGRLVAGAGTTHDLDLLARVAAPSARGEPYAELDADARDADVFSRAIALPARSATLYLAALGTRMRRFCDAASGVARILGT